MTKQVEEKAIGSFKSGLNCAQAVVPGYYQNSIHLHKLTQQPGRKAKHETHQQH